MAEVFHISEEVAVRDLPRLVDRALAGDRIVVRRDGKDVVVLQPVEKPAGSGRTLGEVLERVQLRKATIGLANVDPEFASDLKGVREELNQPLDASVWD